MRRPRLEAVEQGRGAAQPEVRARRGQRPDVRARDARVQDVAEDHDLPARDRSARQLSTHRVQVEQGLGRVCVPAVAAVQDGSAEHLRGEVRGAGHRVAHDEHPGAERLDGPDRVDQRLTLGDRRRGRGDVHDVGTEVLGRDLERDPRPRRRFVEEDRHVAAAERRDARDRAIEDLAHRVRGTHDELEVVRRQHVDVEQVAMAPRDVLLVRRGIDRRNGNVGR